MAKKEKCFSIDWKIENFSYCLADAEKCVLSPTLHAMNGTAWRLCFFCPLEQDHIDVYLLVENEDRSQVTTEVIFELSLVGKNGAVEGTKICKYDFKEFFWDGFCPFIKQKELYDTRRSMLLPQDTLTMRCRIWMKGHPIDEDVRYLARTRIGVLKTSFVWNIEEFSAILTEKKYTYVVKSPKNGQAMVCINLCMTAGVNRDGLIRVELSLKDKTIKYSTFRLSVVDATGKKVECNNEEFRWHKNSECEKFTLSFTRKKLLENKNVFLPKDTLTLYWECNFPKGMVFEEIEEVTDECLYSESENEDMLSSLDIVNNLFEEKFLCDVQFKTSSGTFPAHKVILSASSPVFKKLFTTDTKENDSEYVDIKEMGDETLKGMLHCMYTSSVEDLTWGSATALYTAANKYGILSLKNICSSYLKANLSTDCAMEALSLADNHSDEDLKDSALDYIMKHRKTKKTRSGNHRLNTNGKNLLHFPDSTCSLKTESGRSEVKNAPALKSQKKSPVFEPPVSTTTSCLIL